jgi:release factor glutamine methyltransferase
VTVRPGAAVGEQVAFGALTITFDERVLRPRPWTVGQSDWAAELLADAPAGPVLELCSGAGHIGLLAAHLSGRPMVCVDVSPEACELTRANAEAAGLADQVEVREGSMDAVLAPDERFVLVIADPPWVESDSITTYPEDPVLAIDGGVDGLALARTCLTVSAKHLESGGLVVLQVGTTEQAQSLVTEADSQGLELVETRQEERGVLALWRRA